LANAGGAFKVAAARLSVNRAGNVTLSLHGCHSRNRCGRRCRFETTSVCAPDGDALAMQAAGARAGADMQRLPAERDDFPFMALLLDDERRHAAAVASLLSRISGSDARVVRVDARLRSLLAFERAAGPDGWTPPESDAHSVALALAERQGSETQIILLMERAETLMPATLRSLQAMAPYFAQPGRPTLQVVFVGRPAFRALLAGAELTPLRVALGFEGSLPGHEPAPAEAVSRPQPAGRRGALAIYPVVAVAVAAAVAGAAYLGMSGPPDRKMPVATIPSRPLAPPPIVPPSPLAPPTVPALAPAPPAAAPAPPAVAPTPIAPEEDQPARLRQAFNAFAASSGRNVAALPEAQRNALVSEFLASRSRNADAKAAAAVAKPGPRVVLHVPDGSPAAAALSGRLLTALAPKSGRVETRHVQETPGRPSIRYFRPEDAAGAHQVAGWMAGAGLAWTLQDFSTFQPRPSAGTIEVWLPSQP